MAGSHPFFCNLLEFENLAPELVVAVVAENGEHGSDVAPIAKKIIRHDPIVRSIIRHDPIARAIFGR